MNNVFKRFIKDETGATAIEYGLIAGLIAVVIIGATQALGLRVSGIFRDIVTALNGVAVPAGGGN